MQSVGTSEAGIVFRSSLHVVGEVKYKLFSLYFSKFSTLFTVNVFKGFNVMIQPESKKTSNIFVLDCEQFFERLKWFACLIDL